jgi:hypothetical protein
VLLLGRSGSGKTICICNRMDYDGIQKPWRNHLLGRDGSIYPGLEGQLLKLLYTAVTRCIEPLFFAETIEESPFRDAFCSMDHDDKRMANFFKHSAE